MNINLSYYGVFNIDCSLNELARGEKTRSAAEEGCNNKIGLDQNGSSCIGYLHPLPPKILALFSCSRACL